MAEAMHLLWHAGLEYDLDLFNIVAVDDFNMVRSLCSKKGAVLIL